MQKILLNNGIVYTNNGVLENGWLLIDAGKIAAVGRGPFPGHDILIDAQRNIVLPGFIDLHVHGAVGYSTMHATPEALHAMARFFAQHGVTSFLAATLTASPQETLRAIENIAACMGHIENGATLLGAYLEGPFINEHAKGAHNIQHIRRADSHEYKKLFATGAVKQITVAPEIFENIELIKECVRAGITPAIGHTAATYEQVCAAADLGATQATHTFNAMVGMHHRAPGTVGAVLTHNGIMCEIIADMVHVHPAMVQLALRAKGLHNVVLVTDAEAGAGMQPGIYNVGTAQLHVNHCGVYLENGTLAGSVLTMNKALYNCVEVLGFPLEHAWPMTSYNAARQLKLENVKGMLAPGYDADIVVLNPNDYSVEATICAGKIMHKKF